VVLVLDEFTVDKLAETINAIFADLDRLKLYKENCFKASKIENWENETAVLATIYNGKIDK